MFSILVENYYECPLCDVKSRRKDNIQRHLRNLHPNENHSELLQKVVEKFNEESKRNRIQENDNVTEFEHSKSIVVQESASKPIEGIEPENCISVIKFVGPTTPPVIIVNHEDLTNQATSIEPSNTTNLTNELHLDINDSPSETTPNNNIKIYRKLLSPYLKPPPAVLNNSQPSSVPEPNQNTLDSNKIESSFPKLMQPIKKPINKITMDQFEIYRRILNPSHSSDSDTSSVASGSGICGNNVAKPNVGEKQSNDLNLIKSKEQSREYFSEMHWRKRTSQSFSQMNL